MLWPDRYIRWPHGARHVTICTKTIIYKKRKALTAHCNPIEIDAFHMYFDKDSKLFSSTYLGKCVNLL